MNLASKAPARSCVVATLVLFAALVFAANPPTKKEARVTQIIKEVNLLPSGEEPRPAIKNDEVNENTAVRTGDQSRSELTFEDLTITRLGANTVFSFNKAGRSGQLDSGSILLRVPENSGGAEFRTRAVTVGITGTVVIFESTRLGNSKLMVLVGKARLGLIKDPKQTKNVRAGQMLDVKAGATKLPEPVDVDLDQLTKTHPLITDFPPLPSQDLPQPKPVGGGSPVSQGTPRATITPVTTFTPTPTPTPRIGPTFTPPPTPTSTPVKFTPTPLPTFTPKQTPPPKPKPTPRILTPTPKPKATPRIALPPKQMIGQPVQSVATATPKKKVVRPRPTPTPPRIN